MSGFSTTECKAAARDAAASILATGGACVTIEPNDMTHYVVLLGGYGHPNGMWVASNFGKAYQWAATIELHESYVTEKMVDNGNGHTGAVLCCFLNFLVELLKAGRT